MFLYNEAPIQVWKSQYDSWAKSIGNFTTFFVPCNLVRCGRIIEVRGTGRQGPPGLEGQKEGGCLAAVLLNTNKFALVTKEQMSSLTHCVLLATQHAFFSCVVPCSSSSSGHTIYLNSPHSRQMSSIFLHFLNLVEVVPLLHYDECLNLKGPGLCRIKCFLAEICLCLLFSKPEMKKANTSQNMLLFLEISTLWRQS